MATFTEQRILQSVTHQVVANALEIEWRDQVLRDGVVISDTPHRRAYMEDELLQLQADLGAAADGYAAVAGWGT